MLEREWLESLYSQEDLCPGKVVELPWEEKGAGCVKWRAVIVDSAAKSRGECLLTTWGWGVGQGFIQNFLKTIWRLHLPGNSVHSWFHLGISSWGQSSRRGEGRLHNYHYLGGGGGGGVGSVWGGGGKLSCLGGGGGSFPCAPSFDETLPLPMF